MLLSLDDDCLIIICEYLNFAEQATLAHVCQRLKEVVEDNWSHRYKRVNLNESEGRFFQEHMEYFNEFISCICNNVEVLDVRKLKLETLSSWQGLTFPNTVSFSVKFTDIKDNNDERFRMNDEDTKEIVRSFPNLNKLSLYGGNFEGKYLWNFKNLNELQLSCKYLSGVHFRKIFSSLPLRKLNIMPFGDECFDELTAAIAECKSLEELHIEAFHLKILLEELTKLKKLRKLVVFNCAGTHERYFLIELVKRYGAVMETMIFNSVFGQHHYYAEFVYRMPNLRKLILYNDKIKAEDLKTIGKSVGKTLQEFRLIKYRSYKRMNEEGLITFLGYCKNLEVFDISSSKFDVNFLRKVIGKLSGDFKNRKKPLILRCHDTKILPEDAELLKIPNYLEIVLKKENIELPVFGGSFQCEWKNADENI